MARIYLNFLFVQLIVLALRLDLNEAAAFPPPAYITRCLLVVEADKATGLYRYDPEEKVESGYPKMVKLDVTPGQPFDYNKVDEDTYIGYWKWLFRPAIRFSNSFLRLTFDIMHPCKIQEGPDPRVFWRIVRNIIFAPLKGYCQVTNDIVNVECVPRKGELESNIKYPLPEYDGFKTAYACVTWLREIEAESSVASHATAAQFDLGTRKCKLFYVDHDDLTEKTGSRSYCYLKETGTPGKFPGFYPGCQIYVEDRTFAGRWELNLDRDFDFMPYMKKRGVVNYYDFKNANHFLGGFQSNYSARLNARWKELEFLKNDVVRLEFEMEAHFCIGPDTGQEVRTEKYGRISLAYRKDEGLSCAPYYQDGGFTYTDGYKETRVKLDVKHTQALCEEYLTTEYPETKWKAIKSIIDVGPCVGIEQGHPFRAFREFKSLNTYVCLNN